MPIIKLLVSPKPAIVQKCDTNVGCGRERTIPLSTLELGADGLHGGSDGNPYVIVFEPCECGAREGVFIRPDVDYSGKNRTARHGRAVLDVGRWLRANGRVNKHCKQLVDKLPDFGSELAPAEIPFPS